MTIALTQQDGFVTLEQRDECLRSLAEDILADGPQRVLLLPPDLTRANSDAGPITELSTRIKVGGPAFESRQ